MKDTPNWKRACFKSNKVWAAADETDQFIVENGKVLIKYQLNQSHEYRVAVTSLKPEDHADCLKKKSAPSAKKTAPTSKKAPKAAACAQETTADNIPENAVILYTDGASSGNPGPSGIGVFLKYGDHEKEISRYIGLATNNIAELDAIHTGLLELKKTDLPVRVFTDSSYSLGLLTKGWKASKNQELVEELRNIVRRFDDIKFIKVPGHSGIEGNERADKLATDAIKRGK